MSPTRKRIIQIFFSVVLSLVSAEVAARTFWSLFFDVPWRNPVRSLYAYYPELRDVDAARPNRSDPFYDVLLLGGSVLHRDWGTVEQELLEQLAARGQRRVRIFNLAMPAQTTRDSLLKYAAVAESRFELVIVYHGLNEVRANNVPPELFRGDYSHYAWYEAVNALARSHGRAALALPYSLRTIAIGARYAAFRHRYVPTHIPREEWLEYGASPRSPGPFMHNLTALLAQASERGDRVVLMTFALHVPANYSAEAFEQKRLDYLLHLKPIELWGRPQHVVATVALHNDAVRRLAAAHPEVLLVDQDRLMPRSGRYFNDVCHLTTAGATAFVASLVSALPAAP